VSDPLISLWMHRTTPNAKQARDAGMDLVAENNPLFMHDAIAMVENMRAWKQAWIGTSEDLRLYLTERGLRKPRHHNAWGSLTGVLVRRKWLVHSGTYRHMKTVKSHARKTPVYYLRWHD
jgi:hypothetical protein